MVLQLYENARNLYQSGKYEQAKETFEEILRHSPNEARASLGLGMCLIQLGQIERGLEEAEKAEKLRLGDLLSVNDLVVTLFNLGKVEASLKWAKRAIVLGPEGAKTNVMVANCYEKLHKVDEALEANRLAQIANPHVEYLTLQQAKLLSRKGDNEQARDILLKISRAGGPDPDLGKKAFSELGRVFDKLENYDQAFDAFLKSGVEASRIPKAKEFVLGYRPSLINAYTEGLTAKRLQKWKSQDLKDDSWSPVFLVGFPRSGTTMTEQIMAAHSGIQTTDEQPYVEQLRYEWARIVGANPDLGWMADQLDAKTILQLRNFYREKVEADLKENAGSRMVVDKLPLNIMNIGLINLIFPDAKVIVVLRDPRDCCLSAFMQDFDLNSAMIHFLTLDRAVSFYTEVMQAWLHFRDIVTLSHCTVRYEDMVRNFECEARRLIDYLELDWEPGILQFHQRASQRVISTPSYVAVTEPVHERAIGRWENYQEQYTSLLPRLEPFIREFGYK